MKRGIVLALVLWDITMAVLGQDTLKVMTYNVRHCAGIEFHHPFRLQSHLPC